MLSFIISFANFFTKELKKPKNKILREIFEGLMTQKIWNQDKKDIEKSYQDLRIVILNKSKSKYKITKIDKYDYGLGTSSIENIHFGQPIFSESLDFTDWCTVDTSGRFTVVYDSLHTVCMNLTVILPLVNTKLNEIFRYQHIVNQFIQS